jgi:hypothetical protein
VQQIQSHVLQIRLSANSKTSPFLPSTRVPGDMLRATIKCWHLRWQKLSLKEAAVIY